MQELVARLRQRDAGRPFACCTFDDGFVDNLSLALPISRSIVFRCVSFRAQAFSIEGSQPSTGRPNRAVRSAYVLLEHLLVRHDRLEFPHPAFREPLVTRSFSDKQLAYFFPSVIEKRETRPDSTTVSTKCFGASAPRGRHSRRMLSRLGRHADRNSRAILWSRSARTRSHIDRRGAWTRQRRGGKWRNLARSSKTKLGVPGAVLRVSIRIGGGLCADANRHRERAWVRGGGHDPARQHLRRARTTSSLLAPRGDFHGCPFCVAGIHQKQLSTDRGMGS